MLEKLPSAVAKRLLEGVVIPASPLALDSRRRWDQRRQRALWRYYAAAGAGGIAIGVHTTQFAIRDPKIGLLEPLYRFAAEELDRLDAALTQNLGRVCLVVQGTRAVVQAASLALVWRNHRPFRVCGLFRVQRR